MRRKRPVVKLRKKKRTKVVLTTNLALIEEVAAPLSQSEADAEQSQSEEEDDYDPYEHVVEVPDAVKVEEDYDPYEHCHPYANIQVPGRLQDQLISIDHGALMTP